MKSSSRNLRPSPSIHCHTRWAHIRPFWAGWHRFPWAPGWNHCTTGWAKKWIWLVQHLTGKHTLASLGHCSYKPLKLIIHQIIHPASNDRQYEISGGPPARDGMLDAVGEEVMDLRTNTWYLRPKHIQYLGMGIWWTKSGCDDTWYTHTHLFIYWCVNNGGVVWYRQAPIWRIWIVKFAIHSKVL